MTQSNNTGSTPESLLCGACGYSDLLVLAKTKNGEALKCHICGLVQHHPMPSDNELAKYYQGFSFQCPNFSEIEREVKEIEKSLEYFVGRPAAEASAKFLDYGGAAGIYCRAAERLGWKPTLFDYDEQMLNFGRQNLGIEEVTSDLKKLELQRFDVIFSYHVVEHWNSIDQHFTRLLKMLKPGGKLVIATPNARSFEKYLRPFHFYSYYRRWRDWTGSRLKACRVLAPLDSVFCYDPPRHLLAFTPKAFIALGERHGLETEILSGFNSSRIHEPRSYVIKTLDFRIKRVRNLSVNRCLKLGLAAGEVVSRPLLSVMSWLMPRLGEQLYVRYELRR